MSVLLSAAEVLDEHVAFELECIDRVYCNAYVPKPSYPGGVASFFAAPPRRDVRLDLLGGPDQQAVRRLDPAGTPPSGRSRSCASQKGERKDHVAHYISPGLTARRGST